MRRRIQGYGFDAVRHDPKKALDTGKRWLKRRGYPSGSKTLVIDVRVSRGAYPSGKITRGIYDIDTGSFYATACVRGMKRAERCAISPKRQTSPTKAVKSALAALSKKLK